MCPCWEEAWQHVHVSAARLTRAVHRSPVHHYLGARLLYVEARYTLNRYTLNSQAQWHALPIDVGGGSGQSGAALHHVWDLP